MAATALLGQARGVCMPVLGVFVLVVPVMLLLTAVLALGHLGPAGWLLALLLVLAVLSVCVLAGGWLRARWRATKKPVTVVPRRERPRGV